MDLVEQSGTTYVAAYADPELCVEDARDSVDHDDGRRRQVGLSTPLN